MPFPTDLNVGLRPLEGHLDLFAGGEEVGVDVAAEHGHRLADVLGAEVAAGVHPQQREPGGHHHEEQPEQEHEEAAAEAARASTIACEEHE